MEIHMNIIRDTDRRKVLAATAAVAASRLIPMQAQAAATTSDEIRPFKVKFPEAELAELRRRINATRWPERETVTDHRKVYRLR
jgi:hypothetical protein